MIYLWWSLTALAGLAVGYYHLRQLKYLASIYSGLKAEKYHTSKNAAGQLVEFAKSYYKYSPALEEEVKTVRDPFLREALITFMSGGVRGHDLLRALRQKADGLFQESLSRAYDLNSMARFIPAIGWVVALASTMWLLNPAQDEGYFARSGVAFGFVAAGVFYGIALTYFFVQPMIDRTFLRARLTHAKNLFVAEAVGHLMRKKSAFEVFEALQVTLPKEDALVWTELFPVESAEFGARETKEAS